MGREPAPVNQGDCHLDRGTPQNHKVHRFIHENFVVSSPQEVGAGWIYPSWRSLWVSLFALIVPQPSRATVVGETTLYISRNYFVRPP